MSEKIKRWVVIREKRLIHGFHPNGFHPIVGYFYNPHNEPVSRIIEMFIPLEFRKDVYGRKVK